MEEQQASGFILAVHGVLEGDDHTPYLLVSAFAESENGTYFLIFGPRRFEEVPQICAALGLDEEVENEVDEAAESDVSDDDESLCLSARDAVAIRTAFQDGDGGVYLLVRKEGGDDAVADEEILWLFTVEESPPLDVVRQVDRIVARLKPASSKRDTIVFS